MGQLTIRHNLSPRRNPNPNRKPPPPAMGHVTILRRGDPPTAFLPPPPLPPAADNNNINQKKKNTAKNKKAKKNNKAVVGFRDGDDVELYYSATCRIGPEPGMVPTRTALFDFSVLESPPPSSLPLPLSLLRKGRF